MSDFRGISTLNIKNLIVGGDNFISGPYSIKCGYSLQLGNKYTFRMTIVDGSFVFKIYKGQEPERDILICDTVD